jgi:hypothetical protein
MLVLGGELRDAMGDFVCGWTWVGVHRFSSEAIKWECMILESSSEHFVLFQQ